MSEILDRKAGIVVEILRFEEDCVARFEPNGIVFRFLPSQTFDFCVKIKCQKAEIMASKVIFVARIAEADYEFHEVYYSLKR